MCTIPSSNPIQSPPDREGELVHNFFRFSVCMLAQGRDRNFHGNRDGQGRGQFSTDPSRSFCTWSTGGIEQLALVSRTAPPPVPRPRSRFPCCFLALTTSSAGHSLVSRGRVQRPGAGAERREGGQYHPLRPPRARAAPWPRLRRLGRVRVPRLDGDPATIDCQSIVADRVCVSWRPLWGPEQSNLLEPPRQK